MPKVTKAAVKRGPGRPKVAKGAPIKSLKALFCNSQRNWIVKHLGPKLLAPKEKGESFFGAVDQKTLEPDACWISKFDDRGKPEWISQFEQGRGRVLLQHNRSGPLGILVQLQAISLVVAYKRYCENPEDWTWDPDEYEVNHNCNQGSRGCLNPKHLDLVRKADNQDRANRPCFLCVKCNQCDGRVFHCTHTPKCTLQLDGICGSCRQPE